MRKYLILVGAILLARAASADDYPNRPVTIVVPFAAGQFQDNVTRVIAEGLRDELGQQVVIENRAGAQGMLGSDYAARQPANGYTLLSVSNGTHAANLSMYKSVPYDPVKDFAPITLFASVPWGVLVRNDAGIDDFSTLLARARAKPGELSTGHGSASSQLALALMETLGKVEFLKVAYKSVGQGLVDLQGGRLGFTVLPLGTALAQQKGGQLKVLAVTSPKRSNLSPEIPAVAETLPGYDLVSWAGLMAPAGTPGPIVRKLHAAILKTLDKPSVKEQFVRQGAEVERVGPAEFAEVIKRDIVRLRELTKQAGIEPE